ncbi:MAG: FAD/NAD(P)-binding protein [Candidatus Brocadiae bacterium]|nr:FAD/NAD(P)-binding protein [Candidatus Brocadiia bacterium]
MENPYAPIPAVLDEVVDETPTIKTFVLSPKQPVEFQAGQFVQITVPGLGEAPFTPSSSPYEKGFLEVTVLRTGRVTDAMHELKPGATLGVRGPFGKGYPLDQCEGKEVLVVGGGVGLAPLRSLIYALLGQLDRVKRVAIKYGAREPDELLYRSFHGEWGGQEKVDIDTTVDVARNGWAGKVGVVTTLMDDMDIDVSNSLCISCGPAVMLKFVTLKALEVGYQPEQIYLSMNRRMSCGMGLCGRCNVGPYYLCKDGPDMCFAKIKDFPGVFS